MKSAVTVKENYLFHRMYRKGRSVVTPCFVVYCLPDKRGLSRLGITTGTKLGHAVVRNRARRRLRELYRLNKADMVPGYDVILVARSRCVNGDFARMMDQYREALEKLELLRP